MKVPNRKKMKTRDNKKLNEFVFNVKIEDIRTLPSKQALPRVVMSPHREQEGTSQVLLRTWDTRQPLGREMYITRQQELSSTRLRATPPRVDELTRQLVG
ncbi:uncharacterized protein MCYG_03618 [Microsporum canis CBS 113480]|uniref:Uncharacterized protein n=1 Tax=Arthroderma otae (strain ATCC MYA-4605 / CBS 113480) TaxID=554155 RepID=C5FM77_ARTOC|nr:uncharacterized protein MCYG_03618 [Microsporum canis CBS 113480]EEQ30799.1 predicted protein [Microsporum canis CBS 113480]